MKSTFPLVLITVSALFAGCQSPPPPPPPVPASVPMSAESLESLRASLRAEGASAIIAGVARVLPTDDFLALTGTSATDFPVGTWITVIDSNKNTLAQGQVVAIVDGEVQIKFTTTGPRRAQVGDAVVANKR